MTFFPEEKIIESILGKSGELSRKDFFEYRKGQIELGKVFLEILKGKGIVLAEAGTGTGKSLAYLIPSLYSSQRVVIATRTKTLQDQLIEKDLPLAMEISKRYLKFVAIKGKGNYLCRLYFDRFVSNPLFRVEEETNYFEILKEWASSTQSGERSELKEIPEDADIWNQINIKDERCIFTKCPFYEECFLIKLKREAESSDLIITNHHILFADAALKEKGCGAQVLPRFNNLIIDEAHEAEDSATSFFGVSVSKRMVEEWAFDCLKETRKKGQRIPKRTSPVSMEIDNFFNEFQNVDEKRKLRKEDYAFAGRELNTLFSRLYSFYLSIEKSADKEIYLGLGDRFEVLKESFNFIFFDEDKGYVKSVEKRGNNITFSASPIKVGKMVKEVVVDKMKSLILTSATLSVNNSFDYIASRLGINGEYNKIKIESPFDFKNQALLYIPEEFPEPNSPHFLVEAVDTIKKLISFSKGRAFVLCTSIKNMNIVYENLRGEIDYPLLIQGEKPKGALLEQFKKIGNGVLVATSSFWQGVDVQGDALSMVIIDKIPFASPGEPLIEARIDELRKNGENPFVSYQLPYATMILKQGLGRLIRSRKDKGVVACLDIRLRKKSYGAKILKDLPPFPLTSSLSEIEHFFQMGAGLES